MLARALRFSIVGLMNTGLGLSAIFVMLALGANAAIANLCGYALGFSVGYALNRGWTFGDSRTARTTAAPYAALAVLAYGVNLAIVMLLHNHWGVNSYLAQAPGVATYAVLMFLGSHFIVFRATRLVASSPAD